MAPLGNSDEGLHVLAVNSPASSQTAPAWVPEPDGRGTWKILYSCVFTLSLCVFTAMHLNVGPSGQTTLKWWRHKCKWVLVAILSPEIVLYSAGKQWFSASRLCKKLNSLAVECQADSKSAQTTSKAQGTTSWSRALARTVSTEMHK